jgi:hypothetical protein
MKWIMTVSATVTALAIVGVGGVSVNTVRSVDVMEIEQGELKETVKSNTENINKLNTCFEVVKKELEYIRDGIDNLAKNPRNCQSQGD